MYRMERLVPAIGATVAGPLGVVHLPRMWLKGVLSAAGMLWEGYFDDYKGFNQFVSDRIGLDPEKWFPYLATMPTYAEAERWVRANATKLDPASIAASNEFVLTFLRPEENAARVRQRVGLTDASFRNSAMLINLDDWCTIHDELVAHKDEGIEPVIPGVSSSQAGLLGVLHLPRLWMKALLTGVKALPEGWNSGFGFDKRVADTVGFDLDAACAFIHAELPQYLAFEQWVVDRAGPVTDAKRTEWNAAIRAREKPEDKAAEERAEVGVPEMTHREVIMLNDMVDWQYLHDIAVDRKAAKA
jgi:hypothetical protein